MCPCLRFKNEYLHQILIDGLTDKAIDGNRWTDTSEL